MKKLIAVLFGLFLIQSSIYGQTLKCKDFKTGKFELIDEKNNVKYILERFKTYQTEEGFDLETGKVVLEKAFLKLKWIDKCSYNLLLDTDKTVAKEDELAANARGGVTSKIVEINGNCATIICVLGNDEAKYKICKIK
ncbi:MAG: hypothetical protein V4572_07670 [Bacteroidota bacterium]